MCNIFHLKVILLLVFSLDNYSFEWEFLLTLLLSRLACLSFFSTSQLKTYSHNLVRTVNKSYSHYESFPSQLLWSIANKCVECGRSHVNRLIVSTILNLVYEMYLKYETPWSVFNVWFQLRLCVHVIYVNEEKKLTEYRNCVSLLAAFPKYMRTHRWPCA